ncbi:Short-chain dehydrogenase/reductase SDR [Oceanicola granulosus HTCC2516]|uniref:Short-chain dehydrogenase/reductase SDR n=1 Tax=Oceanicola granulosus (strain ATCC BAA-861 / DSM 15982 / KCTC 12143 / HTCC2516) TaxID=314256 RepID=Q2CGM8_OCEGH|nr:SDR family oxidoreductase [Oceanicola granulosus]EAR51907.1 Short-chain dehydrogenase/reductase SDR [Oceanicola granulosus HTCC2516]
MENRWNDADAPRSDLELRAYTSRLIGIDPALVLHGGGNTSVKTEVEDVFGETVEAIFVKASGFDLARMWTEGFTGLALAPLLRLAELERLSDPDMVREVKRTQFEPSAANASIEAIVHAVIPHKFVDHSHADAILTLSNSALPGSIWSELFGSSVAVLPYVKPGFDLALQIKAFRDEGGFEGCDGLILENHGLFTFSDDARAAYDRHIELVDIAERHLRDRYGDLAPEDAPAQDALTLARVRKAVGHLAGTAVLSRPSCAVPAEVAGPLAGMARHGTVTPEHVIHNKPFPALIGDDIAADLATFAEDYQAYFDRAADPSLERLPLHPHWAVFADGAIRSFAPNLKRAQVSADVARTTARALLYARETGGWQGLSEDDLRGLEYWELEQAKLKKQPRDPELSGKVAVVTGAASGIGLATARRLNARGAVVVGFDINPDTPAILDGPGLAGKIVDATDDAATRAALDGIVQEFGGLDIVVCNAGTFPAGQHVADLDDATWSRSMALNLDAHMKLARAAIPLLEHGFDPAIVFMASRNVTAPGPGAAAYSVAKAGLTQLMRVLALELAPLGIRVNALHPDAVFDTGLWTAEALERSAARYGMSVADYKARNLLKAEITSDDIANAVLACVGATLRVTTGAQIPVDGGNDRVI